MASFDEFTRTVRIITGAAAHSLRQLYIDASVDVSSPYYQTAIAQRVRFSDSEYYRGYLWEALKQPEVVTEPSSRRAF